MLEIHVLSPEKTLYKGKANSIKLPGILGEFEVLDLHAATLSSLEKGQLKMLCTTISEQEERFLKQFWTLEGDRYTLALSGGIVEVKNNFLMVLVDE